MATITKEEDESQNPVKLKQPLFINSHTICSILTHKTLVNHLQTSLQSTTINSQTRQTHSLSPDSHLLLMPSWSSSPSLPYLGVKIVTYFPLNSSVYNVPGVHASYNLFDSVTGQPLAFIDGTELTQWRTACISALASKFLSRERSEILVMIGAGALAPHFIRSHIAVRPSLRRVLIWNRTPEKAKKLAQNLSESDDFRSRSGSESVSFEIVEKIEDAIELGDIVSCATSSEIPLVRGALLKEGAHLDMAGSFNEAMKECDDEAMRRGRVFVDCGDAVVESGEISGAMKRGVITAAEIGGELAELVAGKKVGRRSESEVTVFKSVGSAAVDLLTAQLIYESYLRFSVEG